ncbi:MAG: efflux RND transporter permease subunit [Alphaproteobacteria bacterium]
MNLIRTAIGRPIAVVAAVLMTVMFGMLALRTIPIQLAPDVRRPVITVETLWAGGSPAEVEREIVNRQEEVLKGLEGMTEIESRAEDGRARIVLEFKVGQNMDRALLLVANRLDRVNDYPEEVDEPTLRTAGAEDQSIAWFILRRAEGNDRDIGSYGDFANDVIRDRLERVPGVGRVDIYGGRERELRVVVAPERMARYGLTVPQILDALRAANLSISAGDIKEGKRRYVVRAENELNSLDRVRSVVLRSDVDPASGRFARVTVGDVADVRFAYKDPTSHIRYNGEPAIALSAKREAGANVIVTMAGIREAVAELEAGPVGAAGLHLRHVYDETVYINSAIDLVRQNVWIGGLLAAFVLLLFLRSTRATLVISLAIPVSVIGAFVAMAAMGRSINVISLAGIAFAVGMVVDAAIVVLENIYRLRERGASRFESAYHGARQVWSAVLVSALTTVTVFIPILVLDLEVGQLFRDIAVAISVSVLLSLLVAVTVIPALATKLLPRLEAKGIRLPVIDGLAHGFAVGALGLTKVVTRNWFLSMLVVGVVCSATAVATYSFLPKLDYLPDGNRNLVFGYILPPPGYNLDTTREIATRIEDAIRPYLASETGPESAPGAPPKMDRFFFVAHNASTFLGAAAVDPERAGELIPILRKPAFREPGTFGSISQYPLFGRSIGGGRSIDLDVSGPKLTDVLAVARRAMGLIAAALPMSEGNQYRPVPGLELGAPELRITPDPVRLADNGMSATDLAESVDSFNSGLRVAEITVDGRRIDLTLQGPQDHIAKTQGLAQLPVVTQSGQILPLSSLAKIEMTAGPTEIRHRDRVRTVTLKITPAPGVALETAIENIESAIMAPLKAKGLPDGVRLRLLGTADKLSQTWSAMKLFLGIALAITYLLMAVLFESFVYPLIIILSVPLATAGGVAGLAVLNRFVFQPLDMLTMLGFVILIGIVVNNAILLVHQTLYLIREERCEPTAAILEATRNRLRPIFMSTLTSVFGMLPLVVFPGAGSELYRGLGSVVVGGLSLSAVLTLAIIPPLLSLVFRLRAPRHSVAAEAAADAAAAEIDLEAPAAEPVRATAGGGVVETPAEDEHKVVPLPTKDGRG